MNTQKLISEMERLKNPCREMRYHLAVDACIALVKKHGEQELTYTMDSLKPQQETPSTYAYDLWKFFCDNHNLHLLESELCDIIQVVGDFIKSHQPKPRKKLKERGNAPVCESCYNKSDCEDYKNNIGKCCHRFSSTLQASDLLPLLRQMCDSITHHATMINSFGTIRQSRKDEIWKSKDKCWEEFAKLKV